MGFEDEQDQMLKGFKGFWRTIMSWVLKNNVVLGEEEDEQQRIRGRRRSWTEQQDESKKKMNKKMKQYKVFVGLWKYYSSFLQMER